MRHLDVSTSPLSRCRSGSLALHQPKDIHLCTTQWLEAGGVEDLRHHI